VTSLRDRAFKRKALLNRGERLELFLGAPLLLVFLGVELLRIWRAFKGEPLPVTGIAGFDLIVRWSDSPLYFSLAMVLHGVIVLILVAALSHQVQQARRWVRGRGQ
jgi:hypothetical protein